MARPFSEDSESDLLIARSLAGFFQELVSNAAHRLRVSMSQPVQVYLVQLLTSWARREATPPMQAALGPELLSALAEPDRPRRWTQLRNIGDRALYEGGYFAARLVDSIVDVEYYRSIGRDAYSHLSLEHRRAHLRALFGELSGRFAELSRLLAEAAESGHHSPGDAVTDLYERWLVTRSRLLADRLRALGVLPVAPREKG